MDKIKMQEFLVMQPGFPEDFPTDEYYLGVANELMRICIDNGLAELSSEPIAKKAALLIANYFEDVVADGGLWRSFVEANKKLYGYRVPFFPVGDDYIDYELNREDVRWMTWYAVAMYSETLRGIYPLNPVLMQVADSCFDYLERIYEDAPTPDNFMLGRGLDYTDKEDEKQIVELGQWLFQHSYLLTPSFSLSLFEIVMEAQAAKEKDIPAYVEQRLNEAIGERPIGPLALFITEWLMMMLHNRLIDVTLPPKREADKRPVHKYYEQFTKATGGGEIMFFASYEEMNRFFIDGLGWEAGKEHLSQAKGAHDYVLLVNKYKGMLMARDVARCIAAPDNTLYDKEYARENAFAMLSVRGCCPADLVKYAFSQGWVPDAAFPGSSDTTLVQKYWDMIARCYLQEYYRD